MYFSRHILIKLIMKKILLSLFVVVCFLQIQAQVQIKVAVKSVAVSSNINCDAGPDNSDFMFEFKATDNSPAANSNNSPVTGIIGACNYVFINNNNGPFSCSPTATNGAVFSPATGEFFNHTYLCKSDIPSQLSITWTGYENDDISTPATNSGSIQGSFTPQIMTYTVPTANGTYTTQYIQTSSDGSCPQTYIIAFEVEKTTGSYLPIALDEIEDVVICTSASNATLTANTHDGNAPITYDWSNDGIGDNDDNASINNLPGGTYTIVVKDAMNCTDTTTTTVIEVNAPVSIPGFSTSTNSVCTNQTNVPFSVATQSNVTFYWSYTGMGCVINGSGNAVNLSFLDFATTGTLSVYAQNGCSSTNTVSTVINVLQSPSVTISGNITMCDNEQQVITASGADTYTWSTGANTATTVVTPTTTTIYTVSATTATNGCISTETFTINTIPSPTLQISGSTVAICPGQTVSVSASGNSNLFFWSDGFMGAVHTLTANTSTTIYTVTTTFTNSCFAQKTYTLNSLPKPNLSITGSTIICTGNSTTLTASGADNYLWSDATTTATNVLSPSSTTTIGIVGTFTNGCSDEVIKTISVLSPPTVTITGGDTICEGKFVTLIANATGATSFGWNSGAVNDTISVSPLGTFNYIVTVSNGGCTAVDSHLVHVNLIPTVDFVVTNTLLCTSDAVITFTANPSGGIFSGTGVSGNTFDPAIGAGTYVINYDVTASNGCLATGTQTIQVDICTGINNHTINDLQIQYFPNPFKDKITIQSTKEIHTLLMYDYSGKLVRIIETASNIVELNTSELSNGLYTLTVITNDKAIYNTKIIKQ